MKTPKTTTTKRAKKAPTSETMHFTKPVQEVNAMIEKDIAAHKAKKITTTPKAKKARTPRAKNNDCLCGCGAKVAKVFAAGHDAKLKGSVIKLLNNGKSINDALKTLTADQRTYAKKNWANNLDKAKKLVDERKVAKATRAEKTAEVAKAVKATKAAKAKKATTKTS